MCVLDAMTKAMTQRFAPHFELRLLEIFTETFLKSKDDNVRRALIQMFNSWKSYYCRVRTLKPISDRLKLPYFEKMLIRDGPVEEENEFTTNFVEKQMLPQPPSPPTTSTNSYYALVQPPNPQEFNRYLEEQSKRIAADPQHAQSADPNAGHPGDNRSELGLGYFNQNHYIDRAYFGNARTPYVEAPYLNYTNSLKRVTYNNLLSSNSYYTSHALSIREFSGSEFHSPVDNVYYFSDQQQQKMAEGQEQSQTGFNNLNDQVKSLLPAIHKSVGVSS